MRTLPLQPSSGPGAIRSASCCQQHPARRFDVLDFQSQSDAALACRCRVHLVGIMYRRIVHEDARSIRSPEQLAKVNAIRVCGKRRFHPSLIGTAAGEPTTRTCQTLCWLTAVALRLRQIPRKLPIASPWPNTASSSALSHSTLMDPVAETLVGNFGWFGRFMTPSAVFASGVVFAYLPKSNPLPSAMAAQSLDSVVAEDHQPMQSPALAYTRRRIMAPVVYGLQHFAQSPAKVLQPT